MPSEDEITPYPTYLNRRAILRAGIFAATAGVTGALYRRLNGMSSRTVEGKSLAVTGSNAGPEMGFRTDEPMTPLGSVANYNNFYEFTTDKDSVADRAKGFDTSGWTVTVGGLVERPGVFDLAAIGKLASTEERIYRMRCVEAWSMVIPWAGIPLAALLEAVRPTASAKYAAFETLYDPTRMPGQKVRVLDWPYVEGLRLDEAMHPLTLLATGLYGRELPPQDGAPIRLVVPWKYGFKGIKSIVKINLVATEPPTSWNKANPGEYGFYANVNPAVDHPRWTQANERRIGESGRRATLPFNGYAAQVERLYAGMDLRASF